VTGIGVVKKIAVKEIQCTAFLPKSLAVSIREMEVSSLRNRFFECQAALEDNRGKGGGVLNHVRREGEKASVSATGDVEKTGSRHSKAGPISRLSKVKKRAGRCNVWRQSQEGAGHRSRAQFYALRQTKPVHLDGGETSELTVEERKELPYPKQQKITTRGKKQP